jgi:hypothetical protein
MGIVLTLSFAMIVWIILWAIGGSGFDGFLVALLIMLVAAGAKVLAPFLPGNRPDPDE